MALEDPHASRVSYTLQGSSKPSEGGSQGDQDDSKEDPQDPDHGQADGTNNYLHRQGLGGQPARRELKQAAQPIGQLKHISFSQTTGLGLKPRAMPTSAPGPTEYGLPSPEEA
jgi:hypothetical protein